MVLLFQTLVQRSYLSARIVNFLHLTVQLPTYSPMMSMHGLILTHRRKIITLQVQVYLHKIKNL